MPLWQLVLYIVAVCIASAMLGYIIAWAMDEYRNR